MRLEIHLDAQVVASLLHPLVERGQGHAIVRGVGGVRRVALRLGVGIGRECSEAMPLPGFGRLPVRLGHRFGQPAPCEVIKRPAPEVRHTTGLGTVADLVADLAQALVDVAHVVDAPRVREAAQPGLAQADALEDART